MTNPKPDDGGEMKRAQSQPCAEGTSSLPDATSEPSVAGEPPTLRYVAQQHKFGCQVATCAMLLGLTYEGALALYPCGPREHGFSHIYIDAILAERGFGVGRKYKHDCLRGKDRSPWPPEPWAPIHFAQVITGAGGHSVAMLGDGSVIDPADPTPRRLSDYQDVQWVAALVPPSSEAIRKELSEAWNELHCCDDVILSAGLTAGISDLCRQRDDWRSRALSSEASPLGAELGSSSAQSQPIVASNGHTEAEEPAAEAPFGIARIWANALSHIAQGYGVNHTSKWARDQALFALSAASVKLVSRLVSRPSPAENSADDGGDGVVPVHSSLPPDEISRLQHSLSLAVEDMDRVLASELIGRTHDVYQRAWTNGFRAARDKLVEIIRAREVHSKLTVSHE